MRTDGPNEDETLRGIRERIEARRLLIVTPNDVASLLVLTGLMPPRVEFQAELCPEGVRISWLG